MQSKRCSKCGVVKPESGFNKRRSARDGLRSQCKKCCRYYRKAHREEKSAYDRAYREAHRDEISGSKRAYREAHRDEISDSQRAYREAHRDEINAYRRDYREEHRDEILAAKRKLDNEARKASREVATRNGEPWTPAEDHIAITSDGTLLEIALALGRTTSSVEQRRAYLRRKAVTA